MNIPRPISHPRKTTSLSQKVETRLKSKSNVEIRLAGANNKPDDMNSPFLLVPLTNGTLVTFIHIDGVHLGANLQDIENLGSQNDPQNGPQMICTASEMMSKLTLK